MMRLVDLVASAALAILAMTGTAFAAPPIDVPEPASLALLAIGAGGVILAKLRRRK